MKKLSVHLTRTPDDSRLIGELAEVNRTIYFEYDADFLQDPLWLSPFKLPPEPGLHEQRDRAFGSLFGLFDDSLPDGWGLLLMDRFFRQRGISPETLSPLDRLAYMGTRPMGALTYRPATQEDNPQTPFSGLHNLATEAQCVLAGKTEDILPELIRNGGSPGGARPKVLVGVNGDQLISGADTLPDGFEEWMIKFPAKKETPEEGRIEYAYSKMAAAAGIHMPPTRLFQTLEGDAFFGVKRFDRTGTTRHHIHTFGNLIHSNFRIPGCDYDQLLNVTRILTRNQTDTEAALRLMAFNVLANNRDDHVKNFSFMLTDSEDWTLTPAYDLTFSPGPGGEHSMTLDGEGRNPGREHIIRLATRHGIQEKRALEIISEVAETVSQWPRFADEAELDGPIKNEIADILKTRRIKT